MGLWLLWCRASLLVIIEAYLSRMLLNSESITEKSPIFIGTLLPSWSILNWFIWNMKVFNCYNPGCVGKFKYSKVTPSTICKVYAFIVKLLVKDREEIWIQHNHNFVENIFGQDSNLWNDDSLWNFCCEGLICGWLAEQPTRLKACSQFNLSVTNVETNLLMQNLKRKQYTSLARL